jgi:hypothetical protein
MFTLRRLFRTSPKVGIAYRWPQARLALETLEERLVPASTFVVPVSQVADTVHFHTLAEALTAAGDGGTVTIEPGASRDSTQPVTVTQNALTLQGEPNVPASILPAEDVTVTGVGDALTNLNLLSLSTGSFASGARVSKCLIVTLTGFARGSTYTQNTITGSAVLQPLGLPRLSGNVLVANNAFTSNGVGLLSISGGTGITVTSNTFAAAAANAVVIAVTDAGSSTAPIVISNNTIASSGGGSVGVSILQDGTSAAFVKLQNNNINSVGGTGVLLNTKKGDADHFSIFMQGNDFHNNSIGVFIIGDGMFNGNVDMGGGTLSSIGGNDFRGFLTPSAFHAAIIITNAQSGSNVQIAQDIFTSGVAPSSVIVGGAANFGDQILNDKRAFVETLYNQLLGRTGMLTEIDPWVQVLNAQGQSAVVNGIRLSSEALGRVIDQLYLRFLGRQSDPAGRAGFVSFLQNGGTLESVENLFLTSPEYINHINTDYVQSLFLNVIGRPGSLAELAQFNNNIQILGLSGIANVFTHSTENRVNTLRLDFQTFLHRTPQDSELQPLVASNQDLLSLAGMILSGPDFFMNG